MMNRSLVRLVLGVGFLSTVLTAFTGACKTDECSVERIGQKRCVGNRLELCNPDLTLSYDSCTDNVGDNKYCSAAHKACVTKEIFDAQTVAASTTSAGEGGSTVSGMGGMGGMTSAGGEMTTAAETVAASSSTQASSTAASSTAASTGGGVDLNSPVNGCDPKALTDYTQSQSPIILFSGGTTYTPACIRVKAGQSVMFFGNGATFDQHPMSGGTIVNNTKMPDPTSPIKPTKTGSTVTFLFSKSSVYGFYCDTHYMAGMKGAVYVEP